jgi:hypothetical protein
LEQPLKVVDLRQFQEKWKRRIAELESELQQKDRLLAQFDENQIKAIEDENAELLRDKSILH